MTLTLAVTITGFERIASLMPQSRRSPSAPWGRKYARPVAKRPALNCEGKYERKR